MNSRFFLDTSAFLKLYHEEVGTAQMDEIFRQPENVLLISELTVVELHSSLARKVRTKEISPTAQAEALKNFGEDCTQRFIVEPLHSLVIQNAKKLLLTYGNTKALRSLDALQLGAFLTAQAREALTFVCADERLVDVARVAGLQTLNPEYP